MPMQRWSRDVVAREIVRLSEEGYDLRHSEIARTHMKLVSAAVRYFGSWGSAVSAAGLDYVGVRKTSQIARSAKVTKWSRERICLEIQKLIELGESLAAATARTNHPALFSAAVSTRYYGSWRNALVSAGVDYDSILSQRHLPSPGARDTRGVRTMVRRLRVMMRGTEPLTGGQAQAKYPMLYNRVIALFGTWEEAIDEAFGARPPV